MLFQISSPACTELEVVMMDWLAKLLKLPEQFMSGGKGGGVIQVEPTCVWHCCCMICRLQLNQIHFKSAGFIKISLSLLL